MKLIPCLGSYLTKFWNKAIVIVFTAHNTIKEYWMWTGSTH